MGSKIKYAAIGMLAFVAIAFLGITIQNSNKEYIDGNVLHLPWILAVEEDTPRLVSPWVNNGLIAHLMYRTLLLPDVSLIDKFKPDLASKIEILEEGLLYNVHFNAGNKWSDGMEITLDDVIFSIETVSKVNRTNLIYSNNFKLIDSLEVNGNILSIRMKEKAAMMLPTLAQLAIMPKHILKNVKLEDFHVSEFWLMPVTSGMYKVDTYEVAKHFKLVQNELYSGKKPKIKEVYLQAVVNNEAKLDYYYTNNISETMAFRAMRSYQEYMIDMLFYRYLCFNIVGPSAGTDNVMKDIRVRQAISMAIDRSKLLHDVYMNVGNVVNGAGVVNAFGPYNYNPIKAKELLAEANYNFSRPLKFGYYYNDVTSKNFVEATKKHLEEVGFSVELVHLSNPDELFNIRDYDFYLKGYGATHAYEWFTEYSSTNTFFKNLFQHNGEFDNLIAEVSAESNIAKHNALLAELVSLEQDALYKFPLFTIGQSVYINTDRVQIPKNFKHANYFFIFDFDFPNWEIKKK